MKKIFLVVGARPNFIKAAPVYKALKKKKGMKPYIIHTGQHYSKGMSKVFFDDLDLPEPYWNFNIAGANTHATQTGNIMMCYEDLCIKEKPDVTVVFGDVNSTMAAAITSAKLNIPVIHIEAGLRSFDYKMPEEINRVVTDSISTWHFTSCYEACRNLNNEGIAITYFVGNTMIDTLKNNLNKARKMKIYKNFQLIKKGYGILTLHRPSNVDDIKTLRSIMKAVNIIQKYKPIIFSVHPRTKKLLSKIKNNMKNVIFTEPLSYLKFLSLLDGANFVLTDSGGIQEETTYLGIPCITIRDNTERYITVSHGTNFIAGTKTNDIITSYDKINGKKREKCHLKYWDGKAGERCANIMERLLK